MSKIYPLEALDLLVLQTFNPKKSDLSTLSENDLARIAENILKESQKIQIRIKNQIFVLRRKREIRLLVRKYHSSLVYLLDAVLQNSETAFGSTLLKVKDTIIDVLEELLSFLENRFSYYLSLDQRVPITYLIVAKKEMLLLIAAVRKRQLSSSEDKRNVEIVMMEVYNAIESSKAFKITYRQMIYMRELLSAVNNLTFTDGHYAYFSNLEEVLIALNFNCLLFINGLTDRIGNSVRSKVVTAEKLEELLSWYKKFSQFYMNEKMTFDAGFQNIRSALDNWFSFEIEYLQRQTIITDVRSKVPVIADKIKKVNKVECDLSVDQLGLILRAADEVRILKAKSMNLVFQTIVPHLSTPLKKDLSYQSMRSKSYNAEDRDKEIAILTLEKIIKKIRSY